MHRTPLELSAGMVSPSSSSWSSNDRASHFSGRFRVIRSTRPIRSIRMVEHCWLSLMLVPSLDLAAGSTRPAAMVGEAPAFSAL